ncbi:MAG: hypothetical protein II304_07365 [Bacteroidales bacterium]|nr:hypothetical protein [Bacteroidales bacterium]
MSNLDLMLSNYDVVVLCEYKDKLMLVPCDDSESGYYPNYDLGTIFETEQQFIFPKFIEYENDESNVDGIIFIKTNKGVQIHCVEFGWDGFQIITEERE